MTRSLGDSSMKEFVVGSPYTTETALGLEDEFLIIACDGVRSSDPVAGGHTALTRALSCGTSVKTKKQLTFAESTRIRRRHRVPS